MNNKTDETAEIKVVDVTDHSGGGYRQFIAFPAESPISRAPYRKLGIRVRTFGKPATHPAFGAVEIFDVESGEVFGNVSDVAVSYPISGAISVEAKFYPAVIETIND